MKKHLLILCLTLCLLITATAQPYLYAVTKGERSKQPSINPHGTISKFDVATNSLVTVYSFKGTDGSLPSGRLLQANDGLFYGVTSEGGAYNEGVLYSFDPISTLYSKLIDFTTSDGSNPVGHLIQVTDGKLYGMAKKGGLNGLGVIYSFDITTRNLEKLYDFNGTNGAFPNSGLLQANDGKLYGLTPLGGSLLYGSVEYTSGVMFSFDLFTKTISKLHDFGSGLVPQPPYWPENDGAQPYGSLIQGKDGKLYGTTAFGGQGSGTVFVYDPITKEYYIRSLQVGNFHPLGSLFEASNGLFYGTTIQGVTTSESGIAFSYDPANNNIGGMTISYLGSEPGSFPIRPTTSFIEPVKGKLYSITSEERFYQGFLFSHNLNNKEFKTVARFDGNNGAHPIDALTEHKPCSESFASSINDAYALSKGVEKNTVYIGYSPASSLLLSVKVPPSDNYSYKWSNGATTSSVTVAPDVDTTYTVTIKDPRGCISIAKKEVKVIDVRCPNNMVSICKEESSKVNGLCVNSSAVESYLNNGDILGTCSTDIPTELLQLHAAPNPTTSSFLLRVNGNSQEKIQIRVSDIIGHLIETRITDANQSLQLGASYKRGLYYVQAIQGTEKVVIKVIKY